MEHLFEGLTGFSPLTKKQFIEKAEKYISERNPSPAELEDFLILNSQANIDPDDPQPGWVGVSARVLKEKIYREVKESRGFGYGHMYETQKYLYEHGMYSDEILNAYSADELALAGSWIDPSKDDLFNYIGLHMLRERYLAKLGDIQNFQVYELPQERWMTIALYLMMNEPKDRRMDYVKEAYWAQSNLYMTVATPTMAASGKLHGQLSSCFVDVIDDSLDGIYLNNFDAARLSKNGGGLGMYAGKIRALGSDIKGFKGISTGVMPWLRQLNNTAVSVDQLGQRQGSIAVYLDNWHLDFPRFINGKLNNGDERDKIHDLSIGACIPDLFMLRVATKGEWTLFDPHEIKQVMGYGIEDFYDKERLQPGEKPDRDKHAFSFRYVECEQAAREGRLTHFKVVPALSYYVEMIRVQKESGYPYLFFRDQVNRMNTNPHAGMIYCANLCTEVTQNISPTVITEEVMVVEDGERYTYMKRRHGDFVVCNLSSINLARAVTDNALKRLIPIQMRMLDNVIELNQGRVEVQQAESSNLKYRAVGLGTSGWHHLLALKHIHWESEEAVELADKLYEDIAYLVIKASVELAKEKGPYPAFPGSDWANGAYFKKRGYTSDRWLNLQADVAYHGVRNGYMMAVAPNASTAKIAATTDGIDPIFRRVYAEEKKRSKIAVTVPDLNISTLRYYKSGYHMDHTYSIRQNAARQHHIDQAISFNLYVPNDATASEILKLQFEAWKRGMKTIYYTRSTSTQIEEECEFCAN
ncbi:ribonucleotide reductase, large subunit [Weizmannia phage Youna2]